MNYTGVNFYRDPLDDFETDFSDISDVKQSDLDKILKSAKDWDDEIHGGSKGKSAEKDSTGQKVYKTKDFGILSNEEDPSLPRQEKISDPQEKKDPITNLFGLNDDIALLEEIGSSSSKQNIEEDTKRKPRNSGDWLGLSISPNKPNYDIKSPNSAPNVTKTPNTSLLKQEVKVTLNRSKTEGDLFDRKSAKMNPLNISDSKTTETKGNIAKRKSNLLDDLFGSERIRKEEVKVEKKVEFTGFGSGIISTDTKSGSEKIDLAYTPSLSAGKRLERKKDSIEYDKNLGSDENIEMGNIFETKPEIKDFTKPVTPRGLSPKLPQKDNNALPNWLGRESPRKVSLSEEIQLKTPRRQSKVETNVNVPEWLGGNTALTQPSKEQETVITLKNDVSNEEVELEQQTSVIPATVTQDKNVIGQLANVQAQLGAAMTRHNQNLQTYMQVLMNEAHRVGIGNHMVFIQEDIINQKPKDEVKEEMKLKLEEKEQSLKEQIDVIFDLQKNISKLELQNVQLVMKIKNEEEIKEMELEKLKRGYEFEISDWEKRIERMKSYYEEIISEYETKISRIKKREEEAEKEFQKRLELMETQRLNDLEKLGEFHRSVMEQSALFNISLPNIPNGVRLPLKFPAKPVDEVELTDREAALMEKERNLEVLKATLEANKLELDESMEREKVRREERERELKRAMMEIKMKEEFSSKDYDRKSEQLKQQENRLKEMREEALKEQSEISKDKLILAAEKARLEAMVTIQADPNLPNLNPMDIMRARAELDAALEAARDAREVADQERRRHIELRKAIEEISWEQKDKDQQLEMRERHIVHMVKDADNKKMEGLRALEQANSLKEQLESKEQELMENAKHLETKEKVLAKERLEIAKEKLELDKRKSQLELLLPQLTPDDELTLNPIQRSSFSKAYVDPKVVIMRLKAEKDLQDYIAPIRKSKENNY